MILARITGGLGNQLFQYAAGRSLAIHHKTELLLDVTSFDKDNLRKFDLSAFNIKTKYASVEQIRKFSNYSYWRKISYRVLPIQFRHVYTQPFFHFDKRFFSASYDVYLKGYWQSEKYFLPHKKIISNDFTLRPEIIEKIKPLSLELKQSDSVSVHIRRADYINAAFKEYHGILDTNYYHKAIQLLKEKFPDASFYFFSDDINWAKENFRFENAVYVSGEISQTHFEDLYLMSQCQHNIIANSSFSWWGAWLNDNPDKIVIAPKNWFNKGPKDTYDLYPEGWLVI
jgi:hypothetical protein